MMGVKCAKCKQVVTKATSIRLRSSDTAHKMVCEPCHERIMTWREKRGLDSNLRKRK